MGVPKGRRTKSKQGHRRSHHALKRPNLSVCSHCKAPVMPHRVCANCGYYKGRKVKDVLAKLTKRERKAKEEELATASEGASLVQRKARNKEEREAQSTSK